MLSLDKAIKSCGTQVELARRIGCTYQTIQGWRKAGKIPAERCPDIEKATEGQVTRSDLRPDLFEPKAA